MGKLSAKLFLFHSRKPGQRSDERTILWGKKVKDNCFILSICPIKVVGAISSNTLLLRLENENRQIQTDQSDP